MLKKLMAMTKAELKSTIQAIDATAVKGRALRRQLAGMKKKDGGFTLLELLVVVAILAAIAGTATIMLQDTDRKGAAAAHVAMMDELSKGIQTFRVLNQGQYPNNFDSLLSNATNVMVGAADAGMISSDLAGNMALSTLTAADVTALSEVGITTTRVIDTTATPDGGAAGDCATGALIKALLVSKKGNLTPQNIFRPVTANGCGFAADAPIVATGAAYLWGNGTAANPANQRVNAPQDARLVAFGVGPDSTLFNPSTIGALSNSPVYRHVAPTEYNRFIVLWNVGSTATAAGQATFQAIVDGAGDTKDEELGEVDNVRKT
ncbi:MAG: prepilin-type N-terminal cleavage/methylation domain-containing protein [Rhodoferax sp.]|nr:prepilin-type N-terminal cleavage/methylation domain-containing protein [Rhodoferax sp.]MDP3650412.1 prepilin-type N-terminal cleavage/methylation domain-containing protein [Rhodoferax sp.]